MSVCDTSRHQPTQQRKAVRLAWQRIPALHTLIHNMNYSHNPQGPDPICISSISSFILSFSLFTSLFFFFKEHFHPSLRSLLFFAQLLSFSFPPLCSFSVDVWRALQSRGDGDWSYQGRGQSVCGGVAQEERRELSVWRREGWFSVWMLGEEGLPLID